MMVPPVDVLVIASERWAAARHAYNGSLWAQGNWAAAFQDNAAIDLFLAERDVARVMELAKEIT